MLFFIFYFFFVCAAVALFSATLLHIIIFLQIFFLSYKFKNVFLHIAIYLFI